MLFRKRKYVSSTAHVYWKEPVYNWICAVQTCVAHEATVKTLRKARPWNPRPRVWEPTCGLSRCSACSGGKICCICGWRSPRLYFPLCHLVQWVSCLHGTPLPVLITLFHPVPERSLSPRPEVLSEPSHFSKLGPLGLHSWNWVELLCLQCGP